MVASAPIMHANSIVHVHLVSNSSAVGHGAAACSIYTYNWQQVAGPSLASHHDNTSHRKQLMTTTLIHADCAVAAFSDPIQTA
jgi:hypothetical protein